METTRKAVVLLSGGLDSTTLLYRICGAGYKAHALSVNYGQRHEKEIKFARRSADRLGVAHSVVDLTTVTDLLAGSSLTDPSLAVPEGHYAEETMKATVVPNRNAMMLAVAFAIASAQGAKCVAVAVHAGDHAVYPDCRPEFITSFQAMQDTSLDSHIELVAPMVTVTKVDIVREAVSLGVPIEDTWSCYNGREKHCGRCGTCVERAWAIAECGVPDPTAYEDSNYWRRAMAGGAPAASS